jgi:hypothetical protein
LGIVREGFSIGVVGVPATEEPPSAAGEGGEASAGLELVSGPLVPSEVSRERCEIFWLKVFNWANIKLSLSAKSPRFSAIIGTVSDLLAHETVIVVPVEGSFSETAIVFGVTCPAEVWPAKLSDVSVKVSGFAGIEVSPVFEEVPFDRADHSGLALRLVQIRHLHSRVGAED